MTAPVIHRLKCLPEFYEAQVRGLKNFEIRRNDRNYRTGDYLEFHEWDEDHYTGRVFTVYVTYMTSYAQRLGFVVLGTATLGGEVQNEKR